MQGYVNPEPKLWQSCTHEEKLIWAIRLFQQELAGEKREDFLELSERLQELIVLGDYAIDDA